MTEAEISVVIVVENPKAVRALVRLRQSLEALVAEYPWNEDATNAMKCFKYAARHLKMRPTGEVEE